MIPGPSYLVNHGCAAALAACRDPLGLAPQRGEVVVLRSPRGEEWGTVLCEAVDAPFAPAELLRRATPDDHRRAAEAAQLARQLAAQAQHHFDEYRLPVLALDADLPLDASSAVIHVLRWAPCSLTALIEELSCRHALTVYLLDRSQTSADEPAGCGSCGDGNCSSSGCGSACGSDCSRGTSPAELTAYFANLREQMEQADRRTPLI